MNLEITSIDQVGKNELHEFLHNVFPQEKSDFIINNKEWLYRGSQNIRLLIKNQHIIGYFALIPFELFFSGSIIPAVWWVDLVIDPNSRGKGYHSIIDKFVRGLDCCVLGFPNEFASEIHTKNGWGVRDDLRVNLLPIRSTQIRSIKKYSGLKGYMVRIGAVGINPVSYILRRKLQKYQPVWAAEEKNPSPETLSEIFHKSLQKDSITTWRDDTFFKWRFFDSPFQNQIKFYISRVNDKPVMYLIVRNILDEKNGDTRILDWYGDTSQIEVIDDLIKLAARDAVSSDSTQITAMLSDQRIVSIFCRNGFVFQNKVHFCWHTKNDRLGDSLKEKIWWSLADSDNDTPF